MQTKLPVLLFYRALEFYTLLLKKHQCNIVEQLYAMNIHRTGQLFPLKFSKIRQPLKLNIVFILVAV